MKTRRKKLRRKAKPQCQSDAPTIVMAVRLTREEKFLWNQAAQDKGMTTNDLIRMLVNRGLSIVASQAPSEAAKIKEVKRLCMRCAAIGVATCAVCKG